MKLIPASHGLAHAVGADRYFTGKLCRRGHRSERYTRGGACVECVNPNSKGKMGVPPEASAEMAALHDEFERTKGEFSARFTDTISEQEREHAKRRADLKRSLLGLDLSARSKAELRLQLVELDDAHKERCEALHADAKLQAVRIREDFEQRAFTLRNAAVSTALQVAQREAEVRALECEWREALADLKRSTRRVESALLNFHTKSSLFANSTVSGQKSDGYVRQRLYEEVQLQIKRARKVAESDPHGTSWTRAFHEHHAAGVHLAIERILPWAIDSHGGMPNTVEVRNSLERLRSLRDKLAKAERIMRARMPDPVVFPALLFEDVGEIRDVKQHAALFQRVMRKLDAEAPQIEHEPSEDEVILEQIKALTVRNVPKMEWK